MPVLSPPTPAPSPRPQSHGTSSSLTFLDINDPFQLSRREFASLSALGPSLRRQYLAALLADCNPSELLFISTTIAPLLKRDFLKELPAELALHVLRFVDEPKTLARAGQVSRYWCGLLKDESLWRRMCCLHRYVGEVESVMDVDEKSEMSRDEEEDEEEFQQLAAQSGSTWTSRHNRRPEGHPSYHSLFKYSFATVTNWRRGGRLLRTHRVPIVDPDHGVVTSVALDTDWIVAGLANARIHVFSAHTGVLVRTLVGHELGVWAVNLVSAGGGWSRDSSPSDDVSEKKTERRGPGLGSTSGGGRSRTDAQEGSGPGLDHLLRHNRTPAGTNVVNPQGLDGLLPPSLRAALGLDAPRRYLGKMDAAAEARRKQDDVCGSSEGWGQPNALVVSGGCDKMVRVWDLKSGHCIYVLQGHTSTVRCLKVLHNRPIAVTGSRDSTLRVWDVQKGKMIRTLQGHTQSVRALDVCGNKVVSGSYDCTCRLWDVDTGECIHVFTGHFHQIYSVAFDGERVASGGLDTTVRVWDARTGQCLTLLQGHTALVCQLQLSASLLVTGGADGRVITFALSDFTVRNRIAAHDSSVTALQFDADFGWLVTGGNDGRVRLFEVETGNYVREMSEVSESVWKVVFRREVCAVMCKRAGKTVVEIWSFRPREGDSGSKRAERVKEKGEEVLGTANGSITEVME
ncbi:WD40 repeat-like protein [Stereum hirsutum FP-91666 SS1]|uniref:WD40 repeat-like protein n=1 Tax=Stereum hirsutum (strain FP-91666) TaxID=721885 RepID=R7RZM3_STEHR|nr:WD40 repeat-like protein [Stereum hirsutum FP-91666 SS1]EIM80293.1 WD40 repeat-like protein [Stereum hirsutum FP-91666 SS1]